MLILSRHVGEQIIIGDNLVVIEVIEIRGNERKPKVRIGLKASKDISIDRKEIFEAKMKSKEVAKNGTAGSVEVVKSSSTIKSTYKKDSEAVHPGTIFNTTRSKN